MILKTGVFSERFQAFCCQNFESYPWWGMYFWKVRYLTISENAKYASTTPKEKFTFFQFIDQIFCLVPYKMTKTT